MQFTTNLPIEACLLRLTQTTDPDTFISFMGSRKRFLIKIHGNQIVLRKQRLSNIAFAPRFCARFMTNADKTYLEGTFRYPLYAQLIA